jgi:hypothetical protein
MKDVKVNISSYQITHNRKAKIAVLMYVGDSDPRPILDEAVRAFVRNKGHHELIDANLDNPWMRVVLENINDMTQKDFDPKTDHL